MADPNTPQTLPSREQFYHLSRDRIRKYLGWDTPLRAERVGIMLAPQVATTYSGQVLTLVIANLVSRFCPAISFVIPSVALHPHLARPGQTTLWERVSSEVRASDPYGQFESVVDMPHDVRHVLLLGNQHLQGTLQMLVADGNGWYAYVGRGPTSPITDHTNANPIGPTAAACIAASELFKMLFRPAGAELIGERLISFFELQVASKIGPTPSFPATVHMGRTQLIGVGSVGSAVIYLLDMLAAKGHVDLIEPQKVGWENLDRSMIFMADDVGTTKAEVGRRWLTHRNLAIEKYEMSYAKFVAQNGRSIGRLDSVLLLANEDNIYADVQNNYPPLTVYGTTTENWGVNLGRHIPLVEECILCRYPPKDAPVLRCATAQVQSAQTGVRIDASLPFLSLMAGTLAVAEVIKAQLPGYPFHENYAYFDFKGTLPRILVRQRMPSAACVCGDQSAGVYRSLLAGTLWPDLQQPS